MNHCSEYKREHDVCLIYNAELSNDMDILKFNNNIEKFT